MNGELNVYSFYNELVLPECMFPGEGIEYIIYAWTCCHVAVNSRPTAGCPSSPEEHAHSFVNRNSVTRLFSLDDNLPQERPQATQCESYEPVNSFVTFFACGSLFWLSGSSSFLCRSWKLFWKPLTANGLHLAFPR